MCETLHCDPCLACTRLLDARSLASHACVWCRRDNMWNMIRGSASAVAASLVLGAIVPAEVAAQSCPQLVARYDRSNWWWGAFGNCKWSGGPVTPDAIFQCAWNQVPASDQSDCLKAALRGTDQTRRAILEVAANNGGPNNCSYLIMKYDTSNWWWGAFGNCKRPGGPTTPDAVFQCAWSQVPASDQSDC